MGDFKDLQVWKKAIALAKQVYLLTEQFPFKEMFGLSIQLRCAMVSISSNIAEGQARHTNADFKTFFT